MKNFTIKTMIISTLLLLPLFAFAQFSDSKMTFHPQFALAQNISSPPMEISDTPQQQPPQMVYTDSSWAHLQEIFNAAPLIYSALMFLSFSSFLIWLYTLMSLRTREILSSKVLHTLQALLSTGRYEDALLFCEKQKNLVASMVASGISSRHHGLQFIQESMKTEGKRITARFWQRLSLINDIVHIAPMLGLLGTVLGMFYAFYDINNSRENISSLFDGLGIAVGTTVAGLTVAILSMILHTTLKYRLIRVLTTVENESLTLASLIEPVKMESVEREGVYVTHS